MIVKFEDWMREKDAELLGQIISTPFKFVSDIGLSIIPDIAGYITLAASAFIMLNSMMGRSINGPLGFVAGVLITSTSVLVVV